MGIRPVFVSAPQIKLVLDGVSVAYAIGISLSVNIDVQSVYAFGNYGPIAVDPLQYGVVSGTLQIVKLANTDVNGDQNAPDKSASILNARKVASDTLHANDKIFNEAGTVLTPAGGTTGGNSPLFGKLLKHLNPAQVLLSETFDMQIKLFHGNAAQNSKTEISLLTVKNCRISGANMNLSMGSIVNEPVSFQGLLLIDEEKATADQEGEDTPNKNNS